MFSKEKLEPKKEDLTERFRTVANRKLSEIEKQVISILIEKSKIKRERSMSILNKGFLIFFGFIIMGTLSKFNHFISPTYINILFLLGIIVLIVAVVLYESVVSEEEKNLDKLLDSFLK